MFGTVVKAGTLALVSVLMAGCATERSKSVAVPATVAASTPYQGPRSPISVGKFDNRTDFLRGVFSDGVDRLGGQAKTILTSHLQRTGRFQVMDRQNLSRSPRKPLSTSRPTRSRARVTSSPATSRPSAAR